MLGPRIVIRAATRMPLQRFPLPMRRFAHCAMLGPAVRPRPTLGRRESHAKTSGRRASRAKAAFKPAAALHNDMRMMLWHAPPRTPHNAGFAAFAPSRPTLDTFRRPEFVYNHYRGVWTAPLSQWEQKEFHSALLKMSDRDVFSLVRSMCCVCISGARVIAAPPLSVLACRMHADSISLRRIALACIIDLDREFSALVCLPTQTSKYWQQVATQRGGAIDEGETQEEQRMWSLINTH